MVILSEISGMLIRQFLKKTMIVLFRKKNVIFSISTYLPSELVDFQLSRFTKIFCFMYGISSINSSYDGTNISCDALNEAGYSDMSTTTLYIRRK